MPKARQSCRSRVAYGFGAGGGWSSGRENGAAESGGSARAAESDGVGDGGGGGVRISPVGVLEITPESTRFLHIGTRRRLIAALALGVAFGFLAGRLGLR